jgi:hypothetical protein|tara:strand:- start:171 stop:725 length:555 start_codon:yes stop_codon:yes gene_type:complete
MRDLARPLAPTFGKPKKKKAAPKKTLTVTGSKSNVKQGREHPKPIGHFYGQTSTGVSTFTKKRRDGTVKKTITSTSTRKERRGKSDARTDKTTKTKYSKDGLVKKSKTLKRGSRKTTKSAMKAARDMRTYGKGAKVTFVQKSDYDKRGRQIKREVKKEIRQENRKEKKGKRLGKRMMKSVTKKL